MLLLRRLLLTWIKVEWTSTMAETLSHDEPRLLLRSATHAASFLASSSMATMEAVKDMPEPPYSGALSMPKS
jgi:hypothetical protein